MKIQLLHNRDIDLFQWDYTVNKSVNSSIFGFSWFLDIVDPNWYGLTTHGYEHIMPVLFTHAQKHRSINTVGILPVHAIYCRKMLCKDVNTHFLHYLKQRVNYLHIHLDKMIKMDEYLNLQTYILPSFEIDLITPYKWKYERYSNHLIRKLSIMQQRGYVACKEAISSKARKKWAHNRRNRELLHLSAKQFNKLISRLEHYHLSSCYGGYTPKGRCMALALFVKTQNHYVLLALWQNSRYAQLPLLALIIDQFLQVNSEKALTLCLDNLVGSAPDDLFLSFGAKRKHQTIVKQGSPNWVQRIKKI